jgi:hypothetical protein
MQIISYGAGHGAGLRRVDVSPQEQVSRRLWMVSPVLASPSAVRVRKPSK